MFSFWSFIIVDTPDELDFYDPSVHIVNILKRPLPWGKSSPNILPNKPAELVARYFFVAYLKNLVCFYIRSSMAI